MAAAFLFLLLTAVLAGCASHGRPPLEFPAAAPARVRLFDVPFHPQEEYQCGPATLAMALEWSGVPVSPDALVPEVYAPAEKGSLQSDMIAAARRHGRVAYVLRHGEDIFAELTAGHPVVVLLNLGLSWYPVWHYAVAVGFDRDADEIILHSGRTRYRRYPLDLFRTTWERGGDWGMLVMPPSRLPAVVEEGRWLQAVVGLERAKQSEAALHGYEAATRQWPDSYDAWIGLGNTSYALGDKAASVSALRRAVEIRPDNGIAWNNLAHVLSDQGQVDEAVVAAEQAVACGGPHVEVFRKTLAEIRAMAAEPTL